MRKMIMVIPIMTLLANIAILLNIPLFRDIMVFIYLSFIPGFALLKVLKLKEISILDTVLFSLGLSIVFLMFMGLIVNELYVILGYSEPLTTIPLTVAISAVTLPVFFIEYKRDLPETLKLRLNLGGKLKDVLPISVVLFLLPILGALGVLYINVFVILISYAIIAVLCVTCIVFKRLIPENLFPFLIFSISLTLVCQVLLTSKYSLAWDSNLEYYVFRLTQINGHWGFLNANVNSELMLAFNSMLSVTLLPAVYSALMHAQGEIVFKVLYPFIFSLIPLALYRICEKQFGKLIGLFSALFFVFTSVAFLGVEPLGLDKQIIGELFLLLSVFILISKTIPVTKRRLLLLIFGAALAVSHFALAYIYLAIVAFVFVISRLKPRFDETFNALTVFLLFAMTFSWYALGTSSNLILLADTIKEIFVAITTGLTPAQGVTASSMFATPQAFTASSWINLLATGTADLFLIIGVLVIILRPKGTGISPQYRVMTIIAGIILAGVLIVPNFASALGFSRFYAITLLFLSPCFVLGGQAFLVSIGKAWTKIKRPLKRHNTSKSKKINQVFLLIAIILSAYFLSQVGFVNNVTNSGIHAYVIDFARMQTSNDSQVKINLYSSYIPEQDVFSASWLQSHKVETAEVFGDYLSETHVLISYGLVPNELLLPLTNTTTPTQGSFVYLGSLNIVNDVITTYPTGLFNTSEISSLLDQNNLVYSNGNSEIWYVAPTD